MKGYRDYMLIGSGRNESLLSASLRIILINISESVDHGVQIFDMKKLLTLDPASPKTFSTTSDLAGWFNDLPAGRSHNVVVVSEFFGISCPRSSR